MPMERRVADLLRTCRGMCTVGASPQGFLTCSAAKQKAAGPTSGSGDMEKASSVSGQEEGPLQAFTWRSGGSRQQVLGG